MDEWIDGMDCFWRKKGGMEIIEWINEWTYRCIWYLYCGRVDEYMDKWMNCYINGCWISKDLAIHYFAIIASYPIIFHSPMHSIIHLFVYLYINNKFVHLSLQSPSKWMHQHIFSFIHPTIHSFTKPLINIAIHSFLKLSIHRSIHPTIQPLLHSFVTFIEPSSVRSTIHSHTSV